MNFTSKQANRPSQNEKEKKTIWMGELETWMDEQWLRGIWWQFTKQQVNVKVIRDKFTGYIYI
jgi:hypothetical protein